MLSSVITSDKEYRQEAKKHAIRQKEKESKYKKKEIKNKKKG